MKRTLHTLALAVLAAAPLAATADCRPVVGHFQAEQSTPCPPGAFCTKGIVRGGLQAQYEFVMTGARPSDLPFGDLANGVAGGLFFVGTSTVTLRNGTVITGTDSGIIDFPNGNFASVISFGANGGIRLRGQITETLGTEGDYMGTICTP